MEIDLITFSPTHTGATVARQVAAGFSTTTDHVAEHDMTLPDHETSITVTDTAIFVAPVYGGRVAETAVERFAAVHAATPGQTPAILLVVYGNRDYEDALVELRDLAVRQGFAPLSAAAFIGEHSYSRPDEGMPIAQGRPDADDQAAAHRFGADSRAKLDGGCWSTPDIKGNVPYKTKGPSTPATPTTDPALCTGCGTCIEVCPTGVVSLTADGIATSDASGCIKCCACLKFCPTSARRFDTPYTAKLFQYFSARREPEYFL
ncbi:4Fe-4S binding protein [Millionella massiliensis]|uniref:4Fe-4S binding protein n=1 Tax=Millionella massiliensis TaxID=1871023 RepID=UPI0008D9E0CE|nr:4Fe-4S binding protein [Millionella massiliensis]